MTGSGKSAASAGPLAAIAISRTAPNDPRGDNKRFIEASAQKLHNEYSVGACRFGQMSHLERAVTGEMRPTRAPSALSVSRSANEIFEQENQRPCNQQPYR